MFIAALFTIAEMWKQPKCLSIDERIKKLCICTMENDSVIKMNEILPSTAWMDPEGIMLSEIGQTEDKCQRISLICAI